MKIWGRWLLRPRSGSPQLGIVLVFTFFISHIVLFWVASKKLPTYNMRLSIWHYIFHDFHRILALWRGDLRAQRQGKKSDKKKRVIWRGTLQKIVSLRGMMDILMINPTPGVGTHRRARTGEQRSGRRSKNYLKFTNLLPRNGPQKKHVFENRGTARAFFFSLNAAYDQVTV